MAGQCKVQTSSRGMAVDQRDDRLFHSFDLQAELGKARRLGLGFEFLEGDAHGKTASGAADHHAIDTVIRRRPVEGRRKLSSCADGQRVDRRIFHPQDRNARTDAVVDLSCQRFCLFYPYVPFELIAEFRTVSRLMPKLLRIGQQC